MVTAETGGKPKLAGLRAISDAVSCMPDRTTRLKTRSSLGDNRLERPRRLGMAALRWLRAVRRKRLTHEWSFPTERAILYAGQAVLVQQQHSLSESCWIAHC